MQLAKLEVPIQAAIRNMHYRALDRDGNGAVLYERMARALLLCSSATGTPEQQAAAQRRRDIARSLLVHAAPLVEQTTTEGLADLSYISSLITMELQSLDHQDAAYRTALQ